jgi:hypothetical protein
MVCSTSLPFWLRAWPISDLATLTWFAPAAGLASGV